MDEGLHLETYLIIFLSLSIEIAGNNETINVTNILLSSEDTNSKSTLEERVCRQVNTCQLFPQNIPNQYNDLKTRECMCDESCVMYNDCCSDSTYRNRSRSADKKFACSYTLYDGFIYKLNKCLPNYSNKEIIHYCETTDENILLKDVTLTIPVVNRAKNLTYKNIFCAFCNNETQVEFWQVILRYELVKRNKDEVVSSNLDRGFDDNNKYTVVPKPPDFKLLLDNLKIEEKNQTLISTFDGSTYKCEINPSTLDNSTSATRFCRPQEAQCTLCQKSNCSNVPEVSTNNVLQVYLEDQRLPRISHCDHIPASAKDFRRYLCFEVPSPEPSVEKDITYCFFKNKYTGKLCLINSNYELGTEFVYTENDAVYVYDFKAEFSKNEYEIVSTPDNHTIYLCGTYKPTSEEKKRNEALNDVLSAVLMKFSIFFLFLFLVMGANKKYLQSLPNKIIFSFCLTLLALYATFEVTSFLDSCKIAAALIHYLFLSCFAWLLMAAYDFWLVICCSSTKLQTLAGKKHLKRYLIYAFVGWISPLSIMAVAIYFELAVNSKVPCTSKPGYGRLGTCFIAQRKPAYWFFYYPTTVVFCTNITLFVHTSYRIYQCKRKNIQSTAKNNYYLLFAKLGMAMGLTWTLGMLVTYTDILLFRTLYVILNASQGIFIFFAYGFKKDMLNKILKTPKGISVTQQTKSTSVAMTDRIKNCSPPPTSQDSSM